MEPLYQHGIPVMLPRAGVPDFVIRWCGGVEPGREFTFTGQGFTDGAMIGNAPKAARRAGWAAVLFNDEAKIIAGLYCTCPDACPTSLRAELWAVIQMLTLALPPLTIWVDNKEVVDGWGRGRTWCCAAVRPAADLWVRLQTVPRTLEQRGYRSENARAMPQMRT